MNDEMKSKIADEVSDIIAKTVNLEHCQPGYAFADLNIDSLDKVGIIMAIEEKEKINIREDELDGITTVQQLIDLVISHIPDPEGEHSEVPPVEHPADHIEEAPTAEVK